ncbi:hypothetical protein [Streptomyces sp. HNM0574]|uniref:hypothetical protein n=1 Tax=Streptomyces sp. HNM0574 TaxID=2714954 RepID=UPI00146ACC41|nr:hypothetical protein [Streptomyces sp. HNM0574]NLU69677.1 hypothetical protein [Streptomyces sp. HNM0574]
MNGMDAKRAGEAPLFWYTLPHGYVPLETDPGQERLARTAEQIRALPPELRGRADQVFRLYAMFLWSLQRQRVLGAYLGLHPDEAGSATSSVLVFSRAEVQGTSPKLVLAALLGQEAGGRGGGDGEEIRPVPLPCGTGFLLSRESRPRLPGAALDERPGGAAEPVWQGTVAVPDESGQGVVLVQLVTSSVENAEAYRNILLGVAATVSFTDPAPRDPGERPAPGSAAEAVRSDFG